MKSENPLNYSFQEKWYGGRSIGRISDFTMFSNYICVMFFMLFNIPPECDKQNLRTLAYLNGTLNGRLHIYSCSMTY